MFQLLSKINSIEGAVILTDPDKNIISANHLFYDIWGYLPEEVIGKQANVLYQKLILPESGGFKISEPENIFISRFTKMRFRNKKGNLFESDSFICPLIDDNENIIGFLGIHKKPDNESISNENKILEDFIHCSDGWFWEINNNGSISFLKGPENCFLGYPEKSFIGNSIFSYMRDQDSEKCREKFVSAIEGKKALKNIKACYESKDGSIRQMIVSALPVIGSDGEVTGFRGVSRDITGQKELLKEIESLAKFPEENPNPVLRIDKEGYFVYANQAGEEVLKVWKSYIGGKLPRELEDHLLKNVLKQLKPVVHEVEINGSYFSFNAVPVLKQGYINLYGSNIDSRKKIETGLMLSEQRYKMAQKAGNIGTWEWDKEKKRFHCSEMVTSIFGFRPNEFDGSFRALWKKIYRKDRFRLIAFLGQLNQLNDSTSIDLRVKDKNEFISWVMLTGSVVMNPVTNKNHIAGTVQDITDRKLIEERMLTLSRGVEQSPALVMFTDPKGNIQYVNNRFSEVMGYHIEEIKGENPRIFKSGVHDPVFYKEIWEVLLTKQNWRGEICNKNKSGKLLWFLALISPIFDSNGDLIHYLFVSEDITEKKSHEEKITYQALHDNLTGLPNRALFRDRLIQMIERANRINSSTYIGVLFIDLDKFKPVNDTLGHNAGDVVLKEISDRIQRAVRKEDTVARLGGDEFAVLIQDLPDKKQAQILAMKILKEISSPVEIESRVFQLSASIGISIFPEDGMDFNTLLIKADKAMYRVKGSHTRHINFFRPMGPDEQN